MSNLIEGFIELIPELLNFYAVILVGIIWRFSRFYKPEYGKWITNIVIWFLFPVSIITSFSDIDSFAGEILILVAIIALAIHGCSFLSIYLLARRRPSHETGALVLCSTFPNALLFPFPIILAVLGPSGIVYATVFVFIAMLLRNSFGVVIGVHFNPINADNFKSDEEKLPLDIRKLLIDLLKFPPFLALFIGFFIHSIFGPQLISDIPGLDIIKPISSYGALILVGVSFQDLAQLHPKNFISQEVMQVGFTRFFIVPIFALLLFILLPLSSIIAIPIIIQSMAPPAVSNILYGKFFNLDVSKISLLITSLTFFALLILPFELLIILILFPLI